MSVLKIPLAIQLCLEPIKMTYLLSPLIPKGEAAITNVDESN